MATTYRDLIPSAIAAEVIEAARAESVALRLGNLIRMTEGMVSVPVVSVAPSAAAGVRGQAASQPSATRGAELAAKSTLPVPAHESAHERVPPTSTQDECLTQKRAPE